MKKSKKEYNIDVPYEYSKYISNIKRVCPEFLELLDFYLETFNKYPNLIFMGNSKDGIHLYKAENKLNCYSFKINNIRNQISYYNVIIPICANIHNEWPELRGNKDSGGWITLNTPLLEEFHTESCKWNTYEMKDINEIVDLGDYKPILVGQILKTKPIKDESHYSYISIGTKSMAECLIIKDPILEQSRIEKHGVFYHKHKEYVCNMWMLAIAILNYRKSGEITNLEYDLYRLRPKKHIKKDSIVKNEINYIKEELVKTFPASIILQEIQNDQ